jgi:hypothetical protein
MERFLTPERIYTGVINKKINKSNAIDQLVSLIEGSDDQKVRSESISILNRLHFHDPRIFKVIENSLLSDESPLVRSTAASVIGNQFLKEGVNILTWAIQHEKSPLIIKAILDLNLNLTDKRLKSLSKELNHYISKIASLIGIVQNEAKFIIDLEGIIAKNEEKYNLELSSYRFFKELYDQELGEYWLTIKNEHIEALSFNLFNWKYIKLHPDMFNSIIKLRDPIAYLEILRKFRLGTRDYFFLPESISLLKNLKKLNLSDNNIRELPKAFFKLPKIRYLDLSSNLLQEIPENIKDLRLLSTLKIQNNQIREIPKSLEYYFDNLTVFEI